MLIQCDISELIIFTLPTECLTYLCYIPYVMYIFILLYFAAAARDDMSQHIGKAA